MVGTWGGRYGGEARLGSKKASENAFLESGATREVQLALGADSARPAGAPSEVTRPAERPAPAAEKRPQWPLVVGGSLVVVGLATGIGFSLRANSKRDEHDELLSTLPPDSPCGPGSLYGSQCAEIAQLDSERIVARGFAITGFAVAGVSAAATAVYWFWPRSQSVGQVQVVPNFSPRHAGVNLFASF